MSGSESGLKSFTLSNGESLHYHSLALLEQEIGVSFAKLPFSIRVLLESLIRLQSHS